MRLAVGIITWQDGQHMLEQTIASLQGIQDELLIADGAIDGIDLQGYPGVSDLGVDWQGWPPSLDLSDAHVVSHLWASQSQKRTWLLEKARQLNCDWLLQIDADERLHEAAKLKAWLPSWAYDAFPLPFLVEPGQLLCATWKCLRARAWARVTAGGAYIEHVDGQVYCVVPPDGRPPANALQHLPYITHHPDERPEGRRQIRLGELEEQLEPPPADAFEWLSPGLSPAPLLASGPVDVAGETQQVEQWFCDQCGKMWGGPGLCENEHPPNEVKKVEATPVEGVELPLPGGELSAAPSVPDSAQGVEEPDEAPASPADKFLGEVAASDLGAADDEAPETPSENAPAPEAASETVADEPAQDQVADTPSVAVQAGPIIAAGRQAFDDLAALIQDA